MTEIAQLLESALRNKRSSLLRQAAMRTVARMPPETTIADLLDSDARDAIRDLTLDDLSEALAEGAQDSLPSAREVAAVDLGGARGDGAANEGETAADGASREERIFRRILAELGAPMTIGQLAKRLDMDTEELRGYLQWMKGMGRVQSSGRARATRYSLPTP